MKAAVESDVFINLKTISTLLTLNHYLIYYAPGINTVINHPRNVNTKDDEEVNQ